MKRIPFIFVITLLVLTSPSMVDSSLSFYYLKVDNSSSVLADEHGRIIVFPPYQQPVIVGVGSGDGQYIFPITGGPQ